MTDISALPLLKGKKALVTGIANDQSIAWGCAKAFRALGADLAITYLNDKAKPYVEPLAKEVEASIFMPLNVQVGRPDGGGVRHYRESNGASSTSASIPLRLRQKQTCRAAWSTARRKAFSSPWTCPAGRSSAWRSSPSP